MSLVQSFQSVHVSPAQSWAPKSRSAVHVQSVACVQCSAVQCVICVDSLMAVYSKYALVISSYHNRLV